MLVEMHQELGRSCGVPNGMGREVDLNGKRTKTLRKSDQLIVV
jgi:hypothetical protein